MAEALALATKGNLPSFTDRPASPASFDFIPTEATSGRE